MQITVKLFATLLRYGPEERELEVPAGAKVLDVILMAGVPQEMPHLRIVNGVHVKENHVLEEGDVLALFPPIAGGCVRREV